MRLIFRLYAEGDATTNTPPLGLKELVKWFNSRGFRTKAGRSFGIGSAHHILTTVYVGCWKFNARSAKTGELKPASEIMEIATPAIIDPVLFDRVQAKLASNNPRTTPRASCGSAERAIGRH